MSWLVLGLLHGQAAASGAAPAELEVATHTLTNGLKILVHEDRSIPNVALYLFYRVGSRNERPGTTGVSHFFEHMMFNGAKKYGPGQFDRVMEAAGGRNNAYTSQDVTVYQDWFPAPALALIFDLEADRIRDLSFDPKIVESERGVVASERRTSVDADNFGTLQEQLEAAAYTAHPYQWPVIGWMADIENWKIEDLRDHFAKGYSPSNATMVVSGAVTSREVIDLARTTLEPIPARPPPPPVTTIEPEQTGERRVTVKKFAQLPVLMLAYHVPEAAGPDYYTLEVLQNLLLSGQSSRLYQRLVDRDQIALFVSGGFGVTFDPTLFSITTQPKSGISTETIEKAIAEELARLVAEPVTDRELEKARNLLLAAFYREMKTINGKAHALGRYEVFFGDYRRLFAAPEAYARVTAGDVQRVAAKYFTEKNRTVATLVPEPAEVGERAKSEEKR